MAASAGNLECVEYLLASRPEIDIYRKASSNLTPKEIALGTGKNEVAKLLEAFEADPEGIRKQLSRKLKLYDGDHVRLFIVVVLLCDHYFELPPSIENDNEKDSRIKRFFRIALKLPIELQMILVNRVYNKGTYWIPSQHVNHVIQYMVEDAALR